jgi:maleate isomerase
VSAVSVNVKTARARLGVILPSVNTVVEPWFGCAVPQGVTVHASRMFLDANLTREALVRMDREEGMLGLKQLMSCKPAAVAYCCTASSIVQGLEYDGRLNHELQHAAGVPAFTATGAIIEALKALGAKRIAVCSPYTQAIDDAEHEFFTAAGFEIAGSAHLGIADSFRLADPTAEEIYALWQKSWQASGNAGAVDASLITCLNMNSQDVVSRIEHETGKPVVTSTQATLWKLLRAAGVNDAVLGYGSLLTEF